ncbi:TetR family transcriptional regulator [Spongiactinospora sp. TRM90649]|uniref:TetR/AcrR family transcriptional regulator n=1 Tax=Spongiactinospora sp. TRM90649 TaxID=3031114 RepID=UPI0023F80D45|nr:TetR family transcriptional regulator [Spongiactinospora sp. TRM90649]MDF5758655.1 TetR family transcriptional regulator [Spongiactinospora sp. TRM90649]
MARKAARHAEAERNDQALLEAAKKVLAVDGAHASVAAIAARAGVGIASLYRRYRSKDELFQHLCALSLDQWIRAAEHGLEHDDPWEGLASYIGACVEFSGGSLGPLAGTIAVTDEMAAKFTRSDELLRRLVDRAHRAGVLRADAAVMDISLLIEQLGKSPLIEQLDRQGRTDLLDAAREARKRTITIALDGLRPTHSQLPGNTPAPALLSDRWDHTPT